MLCWGIWVRESALEGSAGLATATPLHGLLQGSVRASSGVFAWFPVGGKHSRERCAFGRWRDLESLLADLSPAAEPVPGSSIWPEGFKTSLILVATDLHLTDISVFPCDPTVPWGAMGGAHFQSPVCSSLRPGPWRESPSVARASGRPKVQEDVGASQGCDQEVGDTEAQQSRGVDGPCLSRR